MFLCVWVAYLENKTFFAFPVLKNLLVVLVINLRVVHYQRTPFLFNSPSASDFPKDCFSSVIPLLFFPLHLIYCDLLWTKGVSP